MRIHSDQENTLRIPSAIVDRNGQSPTRRESVKSSAAVGGEEQLQLSWSQLRNTIPQTLFLTVWGSGTSQSLTDLLLTTLDRAQHRTAHEVLLRGELERPRL
jgi:hypothetical protein